MDNEKFKLSVDDVKIWEKVLSNSDNYFMELTDDDSAIVNVTLDLPQQRVIKNDCDRTRVKEKDVVTSFRDYIEILLTYYCKNNNIKYKQGLNEIMGPFILIKSIVPMSLSKIYALFTMFVNKFIRNYYHEEEFFSLKSSLGILKLLLKYHDPAICNLFEYAIITPEMYATPWILTVFASKSKFDCLIILWDLLIKEDDELFIHFLFVALLILNKKDIISSDISQVPSVISMLNIQTEEEVREMFNLALKLRSNTPYSFRILSNHLGIFSVQNFERLKYLNQFFQPEAMISLPIFASEVFYITYKSLLNCPDETCTNFKKNDESVKINNLKKSDINTYMKCSSDVIEYEDTIKNHADLRICYFCKRKMLSKKDSETINNDLDMKSFILIDLRMPEEESSTYGFLPMSVLLEKSEFLDPYFAENLSDRFLVERKKYHFLMITSETNYFKHFEEKYYMEKKAENQKKKMMYGLKTRVTKIINVNEVRKLNSFDDEKKLNEYDNLKQLIKFFLRKDFPYISFIFGGFKEIHNFAYKYSLPLLGHENCSLCEEDNKLKRSKEGEGFIDKIYNWVTKKEGSFIVKSDNDYNSKNIVNNGNKKDNKSDVKKDNESERIIDKNSFPLIPNQINFNPEKILYTMDEIAKMINTNYYTVFTCNIEEFKNLKIDIKQNEDSKKQIMIFMTTHYLLLFLLDKKENLNDEQLTFTLVENINIRDIHKIITKKQFKHIVTLTYQSTENKQMTLTLDLITIDDSKSFISKIKQNLEKN